MECAFGLKGRDYVIVACDGHVDFSIINFKKDEDKIRVVWLSILPVIAFCRLMTTSYSLLQDRKLSEHSL